MTIRHHRSTALVVHELVTVEHMRWNPNRLGNAYLLTPEGLTKKAKLTRCFLKRKVADYKESQQEIDVLVCELVVSDIRTLSR